MTATAADLVLDGNTHRIDTDSCAPLANIEGGEFTKTCGLNAQWRSVQSGQLQDFHIPAGAKGTLTLVAAGGHGGSSLEGSTGTVRVGLGGVGIKSTDRAAA